MKKIKKIPFVKYFIVTIKAFYIKYNMFERFKNLKCYLTDYYYYRRLPDNKNFILSTGDLYPRIFDKTSTHTTDPVYFYQDSWCAGKIFNAKPKHHYDVGSKVEMIGIISQFTPTTMIDIRPLNLDIPNLFFKKGTILKLPFNDNEIESLSSICVIEHIGLGRYGDELDTWGSEKSLDELIRVLKKDGNLYISVPIDKGNITYFNAHRAFTRDYILSLTKELKLVEEKYIYEFSLFSSYDPSKGFGTGLFHFKK